MMRVVFLCGGSGTRLWPESRESLPKQFIPLIEGKSLLELTIKRVLKIISKNKPIFICNKKHGFLVKKLIKKYDFEADIILEPEGKNTAPPINKPLKSVFPYQISVNFLLPATSIKKRQIKTTNAQLNSDNVRIAAMTGSEVKKKMLKLLSHTLTHLSPTN